VVNCEPSLASADHVIKYLGQYTHRVAITNHTTKRHLELQFVLKEKPDIDTLVKSEEPPETKLQRFERLTGVNPCQCPVCKTGRMVIVRDLPRIRAPDCFFSGHYPDQSH